MRIDYTRVVAEEVYAIRGELGLVEAMSEPAQLEVKEEMIRLEAKHPPTEIHGIMIPNALVERGLREYVHKHLVEKDHARNCFYVA